MCSTSSFYEIVDGPGKWDLMLALFDSTTLHPRTVSFKVLINGFIAENVIITKLGKEGGSEESWNFEGCAACEGRNLEVKGYFQTNYRKGWIKYLD